MSDIGGAPDPDATLPADPGPESLDTTTPDTGPASEGGDQVIKDPGERDREGDDK
ncbi:MAG TPA: hypothetical protein VN238_13570 [Solirubrobacteraceae bacterium]|nr:hypothetical protein [Solirubrobacteraceae bacterium]